MNEDFVSFNLAMKLKEKGFREEVNAYYGKWEKLFDVHPALDMNDCDYRASAPTISQVLKWLREEKGISLNVYPSYFANLLYWTCDVISFIGEISIEKRLGGDVKTYEEAALSGIEYVIDNLI